MTRLTTFANLAVLDLDAETAALAARLRAEHGLRTPDAIHAATALMADVDGILTNDRQLRRLEKTGLKVWLFDDLAAALWRRGCGFRNPQNRVMRQMGRGRLTGRGLFRFPLKRDAL